MPGSLLILISAPSGGGKTTLCRQLLAARPDVRRVITCTTRAPRSGERDGVDYHFLDEATFTRRVRRGEFLEYATVYDRRYGTLKADVLGPLRAGRDVVLNVDVQGAAAIRRQARRNPTLKRALVSVFLTPPSPAILAQRLKRRAADAPAVVRKRLRVAKREVAQWRRFDYLLISGSILEDLHRMLAILEAEKCRGIRSVPPPF